MNDIRLVRFPNGLFVNDNSPINAAIKELLGVYITAVDDAGNTIFESGAVQEGNSAGQDFMPPDTQGMALRIYRVKEQEQIAVQPNMNFLKKQILCIVPFFRFTFVQGEEIPGYGGVVPIDWYRSNMKRMCQQILEDPNLLGNLTQLLEGQKMYWWFGKQTEEIEAEANFGMNFEKTIPTKVDWYSCPFWKIIYVDVR